MRLREKEGLSYGACAWAYADAFDEVGGFGGYAIVAPQNLAKAKAAMLEEIEKMRDRQGHRRRAASARRTRGSRSRTRACRTTATSLGMLRDQTVPRPHDGSARRTLRAKIQAVTADDVERVAKKYLDPKRLVIIDAGDVSKQGPQPEKR